VLEEALAGHPGVSGRVVVSGQRDVDAAGKLKNLLAGVAESSSEVLVFADADVQLPPSCLTDLVPAVGNREIGLAFAAPTCHGARDLVAALHNTAVNETVTNIAPFCLLGRTASAIGATMVLRREVLDEIGGLEPFGHQIADDHVLGARIQDRGYRIQLLREPARMEHTHDSLAAWWRQTHRWLVTMRAYFPKLVLPAFLTGFPLWWGLVLLAAALVTGTGVAAAGGLVAGIFLVQVAAAALVNARFVRDPTWWRWAWVAGLLDLPRLPALVHACLTDTVEWRGRRWRVRTDRTMSLVEDGEPPLR